MRLTKCAKNTKTVKNVYEKLTGTHALANLLNIRGNIVNNNLCFVYKINLIRTLATKKSQFECKNSVGTCERELFECDMQFVKVIIFTTDVDFFTFFKYLSSPFGEQVM